LKICGIVRADDLFDCIELGVDAVGLNLWPGSRRYVELARAAELLDDAGLGGGARPGGPQVVGVFVDPEPDELARACETLALDAVQLHGDCSIAAYPSVTTPWIRVVRGTPALPDLDGVAPAWTLLDAAVAGYGGAGVQTDWTWAREVVQRLAPHPVWLAGGLGPDNAADAIARVTPTGIDVASGAELGGSVPAGWKSRERIARLVSICANLGP
jgi:phosphoribosylanthranilate isomerase